MWSIKQSVFRYFYHLRTVAWSLGSQALLLLLLSCNYMQAAVTISSLDVISGTAAGGTIVTITGTDYIDGVTSVAFGGVLASVSSVNATTIVCTTPPHAVGLVDLVVFVSGVPVTLNNAYTFDALTIVALDTISGTADGSTIVVINGTNFINGNVGGTVVTFGGAVATVTAVTNTDITCTTPAHAAGMVDVVVTINGQSITSYAAFTFIPSIIALNVIEGSAGGGTIVTISGSGFVNGSTVVTFGGSLAALTSVSATTIVCTTPPHAVELVPVPVPVRVFIGGIEATGSVTFTYNDLDVRISPMTIEAGSSNNIIVGDPGGNEADWNSATMNLVTYNPGPITYKVLFAGDQGVLTLSGVPLAFENTFTQNDVNNGLVRYSHTGDEGINSDDIIFSVLASGLETFPPPLGIIINNSFNDPPVITPPSGALVTQPGIPVQSSIQVSDPDDTMFTFVVSAPPTKGTLSSIESNGGFTYTANLGTSGNDVFTVTVTDQGTPAKSTSQQYSVQITGSDSAAAPVITSVPPMEVVVNTTLLYTPILATANPNLQYKLIWISNPQQPDKDTVANRFRDDHVINWPNIPLGDGYHVFWIQITDPISNTAATQRLVIKINSAPSPSASPSFFEAKNG